MPVFGTAEEMAAHRVVSQRVRDVVLVVQAADDTEYLLAGHANRKRLTEAMSAASRLDLVDPLTGQPGGAR